MTTSKSIQRRTRGVWAVFTLSLVGLVGLFVWGHTSNASEPDTFPWAISEECDYPMLLNKATGETWVRACPGGAATSCKWIHMPREIPAP